MTDTVLISAKTDAKLLELASRLAQKISPIESDLEREVINIFDCLVEAYEMGFNEGWDIGEKHGDGFT